MIVKELANFIVNVNYDNIPEDIIQKVKLCFIDYIGVYLRGLDEKSPKILKKTLNLLDNNIGDDVLFNAMLMGTASHVLDLDDGDDVAHIHLGTIVFSTALSISKKYNITCKRFLESIVVGYEIGIVLGNIVNPNHRNQGFHSTGTIGTYISGAVASKLLGLNYFQTIQCLGICGSQSAGLLESDHQGTMTKSLHSGIASKAGVLSAFLAKEGFTGAASIIDGDEGFLNAMAIGNINSPSKLSEGEIKNNLNSIGDYHIRNVYFKLYPFCRHLHSSIESTLNLKNIIKKDYDSIDTITVCTYKIATEHNNYYPRNKEDLRQSLPYAVAISIVCGDVSLTKINYLIDDGLFEKDLSKINDDKVLDIKHIVNKIKISEKSEFNNLEDGARPSSIIIKLNESFRGGLFENTTIYPKGNKKNPVSPGEIIEKFRKLNPDYAISRLSVIDYMESSKMDEVIHMLF